MEASESTFNATLSTQLYSINEENDSIPDPFKQFEPQNNQNNENNEDIKNTEILEGLKSVDSILSKTKRPNKPAKSSVSFTREEIDKWNERFSGHFRVRYEKQEKALKESNKFGTQKMPQFLRLFKKRVLQNQKKGRELALISIY